MSLKIKITTTKQTDCPFLSIGPRLNVFISRAWENELNSSAFSMRFDCNLILFIWLLKVRQFKTIEEKSIITDGISYQTLGEISPKNLLVQHIRLYYLGENCEFYLGPLIIEMV